MTLPRDLEVLALLHHTEAETLRLEADWGVRVHRRRRHLEATVARLRTIARWRDMQAAHLTRARDRLARWLRLTRSGRWLAALTVLRLTWWSVLVVFWAGTWSGPHPLARTVLPIAALWAGLVVRCARG